MKWYKTKSEALKPGCLHVARDLNEKGAKNYARVETYKEISDIIDQYDCVYEVVTSEWKEMYDFDGKGISETPEEIIDNFIACHKQISPEKVHVKKCITKDKTSIHFIIPNTILPNYQAMKNRFQLMMSVKGLLHRDLYDAGIYNKDRLIRTVRSDKCFQNRPFISDSDDIDLFVSLPMKEQKYEIEQQAAFTPKTKLNAIIDKYNLHAFKPHSEIHPGVFRIMRVKPSLCIICDRVHESDHAYINIDDMTYGCFRAEGTTVKLDSDIMNISVSRLTAQLREFDISQKDIDIIISRCKLL
jgi:hypothetical protein